MNCSLPHGNLGEAQGIIVNVLFTRTLPRNNSYCHALLQHLQQQLQQQALGHPEDCLGFWLIHPKKEAIWVLMKDFDVVNTLFNTYPAIQGQAGTRYDARAVHLRAKMPIIRQTV